MENKTQEGHYEQARRQRHSLQFVYTRKMEKRRIYMKELRDIREENGKQVLKKVRDSVGPIWYQVLGVRQRNALDELKFGIYKDLLEGRCKHTANIMRILGIYPQPDNIDLINCAHAGRNDPKEMLACLFLIYYGHYIHGKRSSYDLNARLLLSGILYLGLDDLIRMLEERFRPDTVEKPPPPKPKIKSGPELDSPYLQKMVAAFYEPARLKRQLLLRQMPKRQTSNSDEPYEEAPLIPKPLPPPTPPPPPKKRLSISYCDNMADVPKFQPDNLGLPTNLPAHSKKHKTKSPKHQVPIEKKEYGIDTGLRKKANRRKKPLAPNTGIGNAQYMIQGVYNDNKRCVFVIGAVSILPPLGEFVHGGFALVKGTYVNIHCGFTGRPEPMKTPPCNCEEKYLNSVFCYIQNTECNCGHYYDYGNEGTFPTDEVPFFEKPTPTTTFSFNYNTIFEQDPKMIHVAKEFKKVWEADSNLNIHPAAWAEKKEKEKKKKRKKDSNTCLGTNPKITDYLKCALRRMRPVNIAAKLPDIHLVPELKEWMRYRIYGRLTAEQKKKLLSNSVNIWAVLKSIKTLKIVALPVFSPACLISTTWKHKTELSKRFEKYVHDYQLAMFKAQAQVNNLMWATMCQTQFPDKSFRTIFFSYLVSQINDVQLMHPYSERETADRMQVMVKRRYNCPPDMELNEF